MADEIFDNDFPYCDWTDEDKMEIVNQIETFFAEASLAYSLQAKTRDCFPENPHDVAETLVGFNFTLQILKLALKSPASGCLDFCLKRPDILKLSLFAQGLLSKKRMSHGKGETKGKKKLKKTKKGDMETSETPEISYALASLRVHPVLKNFHPWGKRKVKRWELNKTKDVFRKAFHDTASHAVALLEDNPGASLAPIFTATYLANVTKMTDRLFHKGNGGFVLIGLEPDTFDAIADKYITKGGQVRSHITKMKDEWDKAAVEALKNRDANDPLVQMMLHWSYSFIEKHNLIDKFNSVHI